MQYFGRAIGSVSKTWNSINPATLSGAIDVIVVEDEAGERHCSPFHVRFGKFQLLRPSQKKVTFVVNGETTDIPMKLNDEGEAFFVFKTDGYVPKHLQTSPVVSALSSPSDSPRMSPSNSSGDVLEYLDIGEGASDSNLLSTNTIKSDSELAKLRKDRLCKSPIERAKHISMKLNIPSKVEANGDIFLDMDGYKSDNKDVHGTDALVRQILEDEFGDDVDVQSMMNKDLKGNIRILNSTIDSSVPGTSSASIVSTPSANLSDNSSLQADAGESDSQSEILLPPLPTAKSSTDDVMNSQTSRPLSSKSSPGTSPIPSFGSTDGAISTASTTRSNDVHFKSLRLTSEQLKCLSLNDGENDITYSVNSGKSIVTCKLFLWKRATPIVISDIDGTITKSDALGHVLTMLGRDWTHEGVAKLFDDIEFNGYNIMYLTARSVGLADTTRSYLQGVQQDGYKLPMGPVILSPDRTIAALRREIVLKKPEVFKMACLNDIRALYYPESKGILDEEKKHILYEYRNELNDRLGTDKLDKVPKPDKMVEENVDDNSAGMEGEIAGSLRAGFGEPDNGDVKEEGDITDVLEDSVLQSANDAESKSLYEREFNDLDSDDFTDINTNTDPTAKTGDGKIPEFDDDHLAAIVDESNTPFYAGFGNRITDAISYRSVGVPSSRIFTINPEGDVKMELLELAGFKSSYVSIVELVDQFFPPVDIGQGKDKKATDGSMEMSMSNAKNKYTDFNYWRSPDIDLSLISDDSDEAEEDDVGDVSSRLYAKTKKNAVDGNRSGQSIIVETAGKPENGGIVREGNEDKGNDADSRSDVKSRGSISSKGSSEEEKDDAKSIGSRFSFFMRSPMSSPDKNRAVDAREDDERPSKAGVGDAVGGGGRQGGDDDTAADVRDGDQDSISLLADDDDEGDDDDDSDSDYIYETSEDEDEDEDEDKDEDKGDDEDAGGDDDAQGPGEQDAAEQEKETSGSGKLAMGSMENGSRSSSVSAVNSERVLGKFVL